MLASLKEDRQLLSLSPVVPITYGTNNRTKFNSIQGQLTSECINNGVKK